MAGQDMVNALKQAVQFGLDKRFHIAGAQQELEVLEGLPPDARIGTWVFEWYWNQPNVPHVAEFVDAIKKKTGKVPTARHWFGFVATWTCALVANEQKTLDAVKLAKALEGFKLPPEVALMPERAVLSRGRPSAHADRSTSAMRIEKGGETRRPVQGRRGGQGRRSRADGRGDRLPPHLAELSRALERPGVASRGGARFLCVSAAA